MVKKIVEAEKEGISVKQFAAQIGVKDDRIDRLMAQFREAGILDIAMPDDIVSEEKKQKLLRYLQQHHGGKQDTTPEKIVLRRARTSEIKVGGSHGAGSKTVSIQVRKKRTFVKRPLADEEKNDVQDVVAAEEAPVVEEQQQELVAAAPAVTAEAPVNEATSGTKEASTEYVENVVEEKAEEKTEEKTDDKAKPGITGIAIKRKEKHRGPEEESEAERLRKKKKARDSAR